MTRFKVGAQFHPQRCSMDDLRNGWREADAMGVDSIWNWDHFFPLYDDRDGPQSEGWTQLAAMARDTEHAMFGAMVTCNSYRNPDLLADMARTVDHISRGRLILGIGAGWFDRDYEEYGYEFGTKLDRLGALESALPRIKARLAKLDPQPIGPLPVLIGGSGERVTLRLVAEHADMWNSFGPPETYAKKHAILTEWCEKSGRDPKKVERTVLIEAEDVDQLEAYLEAGAEHVIVELGAPFDLAAVQRLLDARD